MPRPIRILSLSDFHCGNVAGLTPPPWNQQSEVNYKQYCYRRQLWDWYSSEVARLQPIDICVANGDLIDGKGPKNGGTEQIYQQRPTQIEMAVACLKIVDAKEYHFTYGTGYHTGPEDDWELQIAQEFGGSIHDILTLTPGGLVMKWRHHIGASQVPSGRATPLLRQQEWDAIWSLDGEYDRADVMVFSHVHYWQALTNRLGTAFTHPALQGLGGSQLGARRMGGIVDYGFLQFDVVSKGDWSWRVHLLKQTKLVRSGQDQSIKAAAAKPKKSKLTFKQSKGK